MRPINLLTAVAAITMAAAPAFAADWIYVTTDVNGAVIYYDADTIQRSGDQITVWRKWDHSRDKTVKERETKSRSRYDCAERTITLLTYINYFPDGKVETDTYPTYRQTAVPVIPETVGEEMLNAVCAAPAP